MCGYQGPSYDEIAVMTSILPFLAYDVGIGAFNFYRWSRAKKLQSFKALGIAAATVCTLGGFAFGAWPHGPFWSDQQDYQRAVLVLQIGLGILFFYPTLDFVVSKKKTWRSYPKLPVALLGICLFILAKERTRLTFFMLSGGFTLWDPWLYRALIEGPHSVSWYGW